MPAHTYKQSALPEATRELRTAVATSAIVDNGNLLQPFAELMALARQICLCVPK
jgi:hypothetical protein